MTCPSFRLFIFCLILTVVLGSCASTQRNAEQEKWQTKAREEIWADFRDWQERYHSFVSEADSTCHKISLLKNHPGWPGMKKIIKAQDSIKYIEGADAAETKTVNAIEGWSKKWDAPGNDMYMKYVSLALDCINLDKRRFDLMGEWSTLYIDLLNLSYKTKVDETEALKALKKSYETELESYVLDDMSLY